jgi:uncharacterized protein (DUF1330 family)
MEARYRAFETAFDDDVIAVFARAISDDAHNAYHQHGCRFAGVSSAQALTLSSIRSYTRTPMVVMTQLVYLHPGKEHVFHEFEAHALPLIARHNGELLLRLRPTPETLIAGSMNLPYEVHLVRFPTNDDFARFTADPERQRFLHLKEQAVRTTFIVQGAHDRHERKRARSPRTRYPPVVPEIFDALSPLEER